MLAEAASLELSSVDLFSSTSLATRTSASTGARIRGESIRLKPSNRKNQWFEIVEQWFLVFILPGFLDNYSSKHPTKTILSRNHLIFSGLPEHMTRMYFSGKIDLNARPAGATFAETSAGRFEQ